MKNLKQGIRFWTGASKRSVVLSAAVLLLLSAVLAGFVARRNIPAERAGMSAQRTEEIPLTASDSAETQITQAAAPLPETTETAAEQTQSADASAAVCAHNFKITVVSPTCTERGHTEHVCTKCGQWYWDAFTPAEHQFGKYLCEICGRPDPSDPIHSLAAWLCTYGSLEGNEVYRSISNGKYTIYTSNYSDLDYIYMDIAVQTDGGNGFYRVFLDKTDECKILYNETYPHSSVSASATQRIGDVGVLPISALAKYYNSTENGQVQEDYVRLLNQNLASVLRGLEKDLLYPKTGLTLRDFGFQIQAEPQ